MTPDRTRSSKGATFLENALMKDPHLTRPRATPFVHSGSVQRNISTTPIGTPPQGILSAPSGSVSRRISTTPGGTPPRSSKAVVNRTRHEVATKNARSAALMHLGAPKRREVTQPGPDDDDQMLGRDEPTLFKRQRSTQLYAELSTVSSSSVFIPKELRYNPREFSNLPVNAMPPMFRGGDVTTYRSRTTDLRMVQGPLEVSSVGPYRRMATLEEVQAEEMEVEGLVDASSSLGVVGVQGRRAICSGAWDGHEEDEVQERRAICPGAWDGDMEDEEIEQDSVEEEFEDEREVEDGWQRIDDEEDIEVSTLTDLDRLSFADDEDDEPTSSKAKGKGVPGRRTSPLATRSEMGHLRDSVRRVENTVTRMGDAMVMLAEKQATFLSTATATLEAAQRGAHAAPAAQQAAPQWDVEERKLPGLRQPRSPEKNALAQVWETARILMNRKTWNDDFDEDHVATPDEVEAFDPRQGRCCSVDDFRPDLEGAPGSDWNESATNVFVDHFIQNGLMPGAPPGVIAKAFKSHLGRLRTQYKEANEANNSGDERARARKKSKVQSKANREERKRNLFQRRLLVVLGHKNLQHHENILRRLGPAGMSSDESDHDNGVAQYRILRKPWRCDELTPWLRVLDALYRRDRFNPLTRTTRGAAPHLRMVGNRTKSSKTPPPRSLPVNTFNPAWLNNLDDYDREILQIREDELYDFKHPPAIQVIAQGFNGIRKKPTGVETPSVAVRPSHGSGGHPRL